MSSSSISRFWDKFINLTKTYKLRPGADRWYVKHVEAYIKFHQGIKLSQHKPEHVEAYFAYKSRQVRIKDWQFQQIVQAIELLFIGMIKPQ